MKLSRDTRTVRYGDWWGKKKWHILRDGSEQTGICRTVCIDPVFSTIGAIKVKDLCAACWPFEEIDE